MNNFRRILMAALLAVVVLGTPIVSAAQQPPQQPQAPAGQGDFVPVKDLGPATESFPAAPLVIGAYAFVWVVLIVYLWSIWRRVGKVQADLANLERTIAERKA